jgi:CBS domain-containing protein
MADKPQQEGRAQDGGGAVEAGSRPAPQTARSVQQGAQEGAQRSAEATERGGRAAAHAARRTGEAGGDVAREEAEARAETMRHIGEATGEAASRGTLAAAEEQRNLAHRAAEQMEELGVQMATAIQESARDMRALLAFPTLSDFGMKDVRDDWADFMDGMMRTNMRLIDEMFRVDIPIRTIEIQRRLGNDYLDSLLRGSTVMLRIARRAAESTLRPLEERIEQRRRAQQNGESQRAGRQPEGAGRVADVMETAVRIASPDDSVQRAAQLMREADTGILPVGEGDRLVGMVTDRDVAVRLVAEGRDPRQTRVREVMTPEIRYVFEDEDLEHVADNMAEQQLRRLPVVNRQKRLVGVISLADLARHGRGHLAGRAYSGIAREGGLHSQVAAE